MNLRSRFCFVFWGLTATGNREVISLRRKVLANAIAMVVEYEVFQRWFFQNGVENLGDSGYHCCGIHPLLGVFSFHNTSLLQTVSVLGKEVFYHI